MCFHDRNLHNLILNMKTLLKCLLAPLHFTSLSHQPSHNIVSLGPFIPCLFSHLYLSPISNEKEKDKRIKKSSDFLILSNSVVIGCCHTHALVILPPSSRCLSVYFPFLLPFPWSFSSSSIHPGRSGSFPSQPHR